MAGLLADARLWMALMWLCELACEACLWYDRRRLWSPTWILLRMEWDGIHDYHEWLQATPGVLLASWLLPVEAGCAAMALHCTPDLPTSHACFIVASSMTALAAVRVDMSYEHARRHSMHDCLDSFLERYASSCMPILIQRIIAVEVMVAAMR